MVKNKSTTKGKGWCDIDGGTGREERRGGGEAIPMAVAGKGRYDMRRIGRNDQSKY